MSKPTSKPKSEYSIQTVQNALRLLESFEREEELGVSELSRRLGLHKNNVFRLLATLEQGGYVEQSARSERYRLGARCLELGQAYARSHDLVRCARPVLVELAAAVGETAHVASLQGFEVVHLAGEQPDQLVVSSLRVGRRLPAHCSALGKVLLACAAPELREAFDRSLAGRELSAYSDATIVDRLKLLEHLRTVAGQGYALDVAECESGLHCAAAPVVDAEGRLRGAVSVSGPAYRLDEERLLREVVPAVVAAGQRIGRALAG